MIKAIIFDIGGVLVDQKQLVEKFIRIFKPKNIGKFWNCLNIEAVPLCKGEITEAEFWKRIGNIYNVKSFPKNLWTEDFEKLTAINQDVMEIAKSLKSKYKLGIISNTIEPHVKINRKRGIFGIFDAVILSCEVNMTKDSKGIFFLTAKRLNIEADESIFIDDVGEFVDIAESAGMTGILFRNANRLKSDLEKVLNHKI